MSQIPRIKHSQRGFTGLEVILAVVVAVLIAGGGVYVYQQRHSASTANVDTTASATPTASTPKAADSAAEASAAKAHVQDFYKQFLIGEGVPVSEWVKAGYITQHMADSDSGLDYDPFTCSQSSLTYDEYTFTAPAVSGTTATMSLSGTYSGPPSSTTTINLKLVKSNGTWQIDGTDCPNFQQ